VNGLVEFGENALLQSQVNFEPTSFTQTPPLKHGVVSQGGGIWQKSPRKVPVLPAAVEQSQEVALLTYSFPNESMSMDRMSFSIQVPPFKQMSELLVGQNVERSVQF